MMKKINQQIEFETQAARDFVRLRGAEQVAKELYHLGYDITTRGLSKFQQGYTKKSSYPTVRAIQLLNELKKI